MGYINFFTMKSVKRTIQRLNDLEAKIDEASYLLKKTCSEMDIIISDIESDYEFVELMERDKLRGGNSSVLRAKLAIEEVNDIAMLKINLLEETRLLLIMALTSYLKIIDND